jgi:chromosome segregation protein
VHFTRLRLSGFKSFVDPAELHIEPGLTGIVGPNGCGKSNLVEALRWVMGENSAKKMRGSAMDDVIFNGTSERPSRNLAEVSLQIDNATRSAPAVFNDADELQVIRRIEREAGSVFRVNGRDVRARDVQLLFADVGSGAHSGAMVSQGRVGAIINAKPVERRMVLEEAAGVAGLHSRRHEAELRLKAAEANLTRLADVMAGIESQLDQMRRQARQASRYRRLAEQIRRTEAIALHQRWMRGTTALGIAEQALAEADRLVADRTLVAAEAATAQANAAAGLPALRQAEAEAAAKLHRLAVARDGLDAEEARAREATAALEARLKQIDDDTLRERGHAREAADRIQRIEQETGALDAARAAEQEAETLIAQRVGEAAALVGESERALDVATEAAAQLAAERASLNARIDEASRRRDRLQQRAHETAEERTRIEAVIAADSRLHETGAAADAATLGVEAARAGLEAAEQAGAAAQADETAARELLQAADTEAASQRAEAKALQNLLAVGDGQLWPALIDAVTVKPGYEAALGAALGEDLDAPADAAAPKHWAPADAATIHPADPALPEGVEPLVRHVQAPLALARRLAQIGVVAQSEGTRLRAWLRPGQRLVSREGDLWRWDGFTVAAGTPSAAAARLAQRNRLAVLAGELAGLEARVNAARDAYEATRRIAAGAAADLAHARDALRQAERAATDARGAHEQASRAAQQRSTRLAGLTETVERTAAEIAELEDGLVGLRQLLSGLAPEDEGRDRIAALKATVAERRTALAEARGAHDQLRRDRAARAARLEALTADHRNWADRAADAERQVAALAARREEAERGLAALAQKPAEIATQRAALLDQIGLAEAERTQAADALATAEAALAAADRAAKAAQAALAEAREERVRREAGLGQARERLEEIAARVREALECLPEGALAAGGVDGDEALPPLEEAEAKLERLKRERENMGPVNLRAEQEAQELETQLNGMTAERQDLEHAINRLRGAIGSLNREGRERLLAAYQKVDGHFRDLFTRLFGGGQAHLALTESEDPLEAGLEIMASPPGKRMQVLSLLSGGEQALTALALLFAVFLTNPTPVCVLDEVDAPLDDNNVERFCALVHEIAQTSGTRFLCVTHHPVTMARMDRLFGVTMAERGVSQLVSVDLARAERLVEGQLATA